MLHSESLHPSAQLTSFRIARRLIAGFHLPQAIAAQHGDHATTASNIVREAWKECMDKTQKGFLVSAQQSGVGENDVVQAFNLNHMTPEGQRLVARNAYDHLLVVAHESSPLQMTMHAVVNNCRSKGPVGIAIGAAIADINQQFISYISHVSRIAFNENATNTGEPLRLGNIIRQSNAALVTPTT